MISPILLYNFYYVSYIYENQKYSNEYAVGSFLNSLRLEYLNSFKKMIINQIIKYMDRGRVDDDIYDIMKKKNLNIDNLKITYELLDRLMRKTYRSDMRRRNVVWEYLTKHLAELEKSKKIKDIIFNIDRINNAVHNTDELTLSKFKDGYKLEETFNEIHQMTPEELETKVSDDIRKIKKEEPKDKENASRERLFGPGLKFESFGITYLKIKKDLIL